MKKITVIKTNYGVNKIPVIQLNYHDGEDRWSELSLDNKTIVDLDKLESAIDT